MNKEGENSSLIKKAVEKLSKSSPMTKALLLTAFLMTVSCAEGCIKNTKINKYGVSFFRMSKQERAAIKRLTDTLSLSGCGAYTFPLESGDVVKVSRTSIPCVGGIEAYKNNQKVDITPEDVAPLIKEIMATQQSPIKHK